MSVKRYTSDADTTITNAFKRGLNTRATGSNMGAADSLEVFALFGQKTSGSIEKSRILVKFPVSTINSDRTSGAIPASGSVNFYLNLGNVEHDETIPKGVILEIAPVSTEWDEGYGKDLSSYLDPGIGSKGLGANWVYARSGSGGPVAWTTEGGDFDSDVTFTQELEEGYEDLNLDITPLVEEWIAGTKSNYGVVVRVTGSQEEQSNPSLSYYTKKFSARNSEYFFSRPTIEARWDDTTKDNRGNALVSASNLSSDDNLNTVYFYNYVKGQLKNLPGDPENVYVRLYSSRTNQDEVTTTPSSPITGGVTSTGIYSASLAAYTTSSILYDRWFSDVSGGICYFTGSICFKAHSPSSVATEEEHEIKITNLKDRYYQREEPRLRLYTRRRNWNPNIYNIATSEPVLNIAEDVYYRVTRIQDDKEVVAYGTGSLNHTRLSYDVSGSYFDFDMSLLEPNYSYQFEFAIYSNGEYKENYKTFKFRVEENLGDI